MAFHSVKNSRRKLDRYLLFGRGYAIALVRNFQTKNQQCVENAAHISRVHSSFLRATPLVSLLCRKCHDVFTRKRKIN